jgi:hypothetical protein
VPQVRDCHASCCLFFLYSFIFSSASRKNEANAGETYSMTSSKCSAGMSSSAQSASGKQSSSTLAVVDWG